MGLESFHSIHTFLKDGGLADILKVAKAPAMLIGVDQIGLPRTKVTLHTSASADDISESVSNLFQQTGLDVEVVQQRHTFPKRAKDKAISALAERFSHEWLAYDPVGGARVLRAINKGAETVRGIFGPRISGLYWLHREKTLQVMLNRKVVEERKERSLTILRDTEAILQHNINLSLSKVSASLNLVVLPSFEQPHPEGVPVDMESLKHSAEYGVLFGKSIAPTDIMYGLPFEVPASRMKPVKQKVAAASVAALIGLTPACGGGGGGGGSTPVEEQFAGSPAAVSGITAVAGDTQTTVSWDAVEGATSYTLYWDTEAVTRSTARAADCTGESFAGITETSFTHTGLTNGTSYNYNVTAVDADGDEGRCSVSGAAVTPTVATVAGCMDSSASNYDPNANENDGSCRYPAAPTPEPTPTPTPTPTPEPGGNSSGGSGF